MRVLARSSLEAYLFALAALAASALPMTWYLRSILVLVMVGVIIDLIIRSPWTANWRWKPKLFSGVVVVGLLLAAAWRPVMDDYRGVEKPDVTLDFAYPQEPVLLIRNISNKTAFQIKWSVVVWNRDTIPAKMNPLPIPVQTFDFLGAHASGGPMGLFSLPSVAPLVKPGNNLLGVASITCPECSRGRTFVVSIIFGKSGWFAEIPGMNTGEILMPTHFTADNTELYFTSLLSAVATVPHVSIKDP